MAVALCGTVVLAGWVIARVAGVGLPGDASPAGDGSVDARPIAAPGATFNANWVAAVAALTGTGEPDDAQAIVEVASLDPSRTLPSEMPPDAKEAVSSIETIAVGPLPDYGKANPIDQRDTDWTAPGQPLPIDAFGYVGGLFEARFYQPHSTTDDPLEEVGQAASLYGVDSAMMMSIAKVESDFNPRARTGSYKGLFQLNDYEFEKYGDGSIWDARDNARAAAHMFLVQAEKFKWALGHYPDYAERYMVHQQGIQGAIEHYTHPERVAWQSMCATDEGMLKGERWCKQCIWGNLRPEWKHAFGNVENISSGDFIRLWTGRIDHFANRYSGAQGVASMGQSHAKRPTILAVSSGRAPHANARQPRSSVALAGRKRPVLSHAIASSRTGSSTPRAGARPGQTVATAAKRAIAGGRAQKQAVAVPKRSTAGRARTHT
jgi:predicted GIY-YIG superfamily endonuclease